MLNDLATELSKLYTSKEAAERVVGYAGIPKTFIDFDGPLAEVWPRIVKQAMARDKLPDLLRVAIKDYANNVALQRIFGALVYRLPSGDSVDEIVVDARSASDPERLRQLEHTVARMSELLKGSEWGGKGLVAAMERLEVKVDALTHEVGRIIDNQRLHRRVVISLSVICALLLVAVVTLAYVIATST